MPKAAATAPAASTPSTSQEPSTQSPDPMDDGGVFQGDPAKPFDEQQPSKQQPAKPAKPTPTEPEKVKVRFGNEEIETDAASAAFMNAMAGQIQLLTTQHAATRPNDPVVKPDAYDYETGLFTEPKVAIAKLRAEIKAEVKEEMSGMYSAAESKKDFWNNFYTDHDDLKNEKLLVNAVLTRDYNKLSVMEVSAAAKSLAESVKRELLRLKGSKSDSDDSSRPIEGGSTRTFTPPVGQQQDSTVLSLSGVIRQRQAARQKAQFHKE